MARRERDKLSTYRELSLNTANMSNVCGFLQREDRRLKTWRSSPCSDAPPNTYDGQYICVHEVNMDEQYLYMRTGVARVHRSICSARRVDISWLSCYGIPSSFLTSDGVRPL